MKYFFLPLMLMMISIEGISQDKIYLKDNSIIQAKVSEVGISEIKYKKWENLNGPDYVILKSTVALVIYENGTHETMSQPVVHTQDENEVIAILPYYKTGKNLIGINYFDLIYKNITLNYSRFLCNHRFSVNGSLSIGFTNEEGYSNGNSFLYFDKDYFHSTLSFNYFPVGMNKVSYYTGLTFMMGSGAEYTNYYYEPTDLITRNYYGFYVANGIQFNLTKHFNMRTALNLGLVDRDNNGDFQTHALFEISAGIRF